MKVKLATKRIGALALSLLIGLGSCVTTNIQKAYATDELESQASDSISSATTSGGDAVTLADALGSEDEDTGIATLGLGDQYTVTFNLNGGTLDPINNTTDNQQVTVEEGQTVQNPGYPVKYESNSMGDYINMYKLDKWTLDGEEYDFSTPVTSNIELTATYSQMYITFDGNGGLLTNVAGAFGPFTDQASVTKKVYKDILMVLFFTQGAREGFTFDGFDEKPDGTGTAEIPYSGDLPMLGKYLSDINYTSVGGDITFYAKWTAEAGIEGKFDPMNGGAVITKNAVTVNGNKVFEKPADPEKEGYEFLGWVDATKYDEFMNFTTGYFEDYELNGSGTYKTCSVAEALESGYYNIANEYYGASRYLYDFDTAVTSNMEFKAVYNKKNCKLGFVIVGHEDCNSCNLLKMNTRFASYHLGYNDNLINLTTYEQYKDKYELYGHVEGWYTDKKCTPGNEVDLDNTKFDSLNVEKDGDTYVATIYGKFVFNTTEVWIIPNNGPKYCDQSYKNGQSYVNPNYKLGDLMVGHTLEQSGLTLPVLTRKGSNFQGWTIDYVLSNSDRIDLYGTTDGWDPTKNVINSGWEYDREVIDPAVTPTTIKVHEYKENPDDEYYRYKYYIYEKIVYDARWDYKVVIDYDNGIEPTEEYVVKFNEATPKLKVPAAKEGYTFAGWGTQFWSVPDKGSGYTWLVNENNASANFEAFYKKIDNHNGLINDVRKEKIMGKSGEYLRLAGLDNTPDYDSEVTYIKAIWIKNDDSHQHTWNTNWSSDDNNHWHDATCGHDVKKDQAPHTPSDWVIDKQPTSSSEGLKHKECTVCHKVLETGKIAKIEIIIQPEATPTPSATPVPSATPTSEPKHEHEFSKEWTTNESSHWHDATCGHDVRDGEAPHTSSDWIVAKQPTETEEGYRYKECTVCYDVLETEIIDRLSSMVIEVPEESDPQPVVEETVTEEPIETPAPVVTPAPTTKEDKVIVAPVFDNGDQDAENMQGAMGRFLEGVKTVAVVLSISLAAVLGILGLLLLILAAMRRVKVQNDRSSDYEESNFVTVYKTSVNTEGSRIAQLFRKNDRVWNVVIPEEVVADRVTDFFKVVLTKSFCKRYNGEQLIVIMDSEDDQVKKQFGFVIDGEDNEINITIKE